MFRIRSRWRSALRDSCLLVVGVLFGLCLSNFVEIFKLSRSIKEKDDSDLSTHNKAGLVVSLPRNVIRNYNNNTSLNRIHNQATVNHSTDKKNRPRPKYLKDELTLRQPLYVGVVTAVNFLNTRATDINGTWAHKLSKVDYFVAEGQGAHPLSVVSLQGVDDSYPPQKKVFRMLRYMHDNYIDQFNWFLRADDDAYIRVPELIQFLSLLDPTEPLYIGSPGLGRPEDLERIKLLPHERYCMGGPGVIFSRALLVQLVPFLDDCLSNVVVSYNEDLEVGRCISRRLGIQCTWAYEMRKLFFMDYTKGEMFKDDKVYQDKSFASAITAHPFKNSDMLHRVHQFFIEVAIQQNIQLGIKLKKELESVQKRTKKKKAFP